jgi:hypothetical protein
MTLRGKEVVMSSSSVGGPKQGGRPRRILVTATMVALSSASVRTVAAADEALRCQIPFTFTVDKATLPPGTYRVAVDEAVGTLEVRDLPRFERVEVPAL